MATVGIVEAKKAVRYLVYQSTNMIRVFYVFFVSTSVVFMSRWKNHLKTVCSTQVDTEYCQGGPSCDDYYSFRARWDTPAEPYFWSKLKLNIIKLRAFDYYVTYMI